MSTEKSSTLESGVRVVELEIQIKASVERTWNALAKEIGVWWRRDFLTDASAKGFVLELRLGGKLYEDWGNGEGAIWATVNVLRAPRVLELAGFCAPAWGGPNTHYHSFHLEEHAGGTRVRFSDAVHGRVDDANATSLREGWLLLFDALRTYCEA